MSKLKAMISDITSSIRNILNDTEYGQGLSTNDKKVYSVKKNIEKIVGDLKQTEEVAKYYEVGYSIGIGNTSCWPYIIIKSEDTSAQKGVYLTITFKMCQKKGESASGYSKKAFVIFNQANEEFKNNKEKIEQRRNLLQEYVSSEVLTQNTSEGNEGYFDDCEIYYAELDGTNDCQRILYALEIYKEYLKKRNLIENVKLIQEKYNIVLTGAPGTGKTYLAKEIAASLVANTKYSNLSDDEKKQIGFVQFHPSYDYTDFVEGLRSYDNGGQIGFRRQDGVFKKFCKEALKSWNEAENKKDAKKYVFIIDEINRGELSKIYGELFYSIDPGYRGEEGMVQTQYQNLVDYERDSKGQMLDERGNVITDVTKAKEDIFKPGFYVPKNVYIIGTMNDIDRSVEPMDFAVRRRFVWIDIKPEDRIAMWGDEDWFAQAKRAMCNINSVIRLIDALGEPFCLGPAYFKDPNVIGNSIDLFDLWSLRIEPILREYLRVIPKQEAEQYYKLLKGALFYNDDLAEIKSLEKIDKALSSKKNKAESSDDETD